MSITTWKPFGEFDASFDDPFTQSCLRLGIDLAADIYEENGSLVVALNLPGVSPDELDITLERDLLVVSGMRRETKEALEKEYYAKEIRRGSFFRSIRLPRSVEEKKASAAYENGMLTITLPIEEREPAPPVRVPLEK